MKFITALPLLLILLLPFTTIYGQDRCGTVEYEQLKHLETKKYFEDWLKNKISQKKINSQNSYRQERTEAVITIPVVVHVIHNGEPIGTGLNIPDAQIISQIDVLNEDFRRTNADKINTPSVFTSVAADIEVEFIMAKRNPEGLSTNGIIRVQGSKTTWSMSDDIELKAQSYWPAEDYLNIWVTQVSNGLLGYAQYPVSDLVGLEDSSNSSLTDGVVVDFEAFGSKDKYPPAILKNRYALGRTASHEVGHFLGLRHIWGDGGCSVDDFCADTPSAISDNGGLSDCTFPGPNSCNQGVGDLPDMFQNFMDYTDDICMNLFTLDQKSRMKTVLENSPRRLSLTTSKGGLNPIVVDNDLGIRSILSPLTFVCDNQITPQLELRNYGANNATQVTIEVLLNSIVVQTTSFNFNLNYLDIINVSLSPVVLNTTSEQELMFQITTTNNVADGSSENNTKSMSLLIPPETTLPLLETFNSTPIDWRFENSSGNFLWEMVQLSNKPIGDSSLLLNCYNYEVQNEKTYLISPIIDLSQTNFALLLFDVAHANYTGFPDELKVVVSTDCGNSFIDANTLYTKSGSGLATVGSKTSEFFPTSENDWRTESLDLTDYLGKKIQIGIIGVNGFGNNIFLDNISLITSEFTDIGMKAVLSPSPVLGFENHELTFDIVNFGSSVINSFDYFITHNNGNKQFFSATGLAINSGQVYTITHGNIVGNEGLNSIKIELANPNGEVEVQLSNNALTYYYTVDKSSNTIPIQEPFEKEVTFITNSQYPNEVVWNPFMIGDNTTMMINGSAHIHKNTEEWLVTPALDFSDYEEASVFFDLSYSLATSGTSDQFKILVSKDNGLSYTPTLFSRKGEALATTAIQKDAWLPINSADWRTEYLDLTDYAQNEAVRVAFVFNNQNGNALYIDNVEFYVEANPDTLTRNESVVIGPNPIKPSVDNLNIYFELEQRQPVTITLYNQTGQLLYKNHISNALNQHYQFPLGDLPSGMVIIRVIGTSFQYSERIVVIK